MRISFSFCFNFLSTVNRPIINYKNITNHNFIHALSMLVPEYINIIVQLLDLNLYIKQ